jgi:hypothetical protein
MFIQTVIQHLLGKQKREIANAKPGTEKELSPMAQSILEKLAEHEKSSALKRPTENLPKNKGEE